MRVGTVDVGTNSILLLVVETGAGGEPIVIDDRCRIERLGRGVDRTGLLAEENVANSLDALREYAAAIRAAGCERVAAVGTQALREAKNGASFLEPAAEILGVPVEVIGGRREAELVQLAVVRSFPELAANGDLVVFDVGGGSTEYIVSHAGRIASLVSLPLGSVRLTERFVKSDPATAEETAALERFLDDTLATLALPKDAPLVGTAGTVTTLAAVSIGLEPYDAARVHGMRLDAGEVQRQVGEYAAKTVAQRREIDGLEEKRADVILAGAMIVARTMARVGARTITISDRGVRWGLAYELFE